MFRRRALLLLYILAVAGINLGASSKCENQPPELTSVTATGDLRQGEQGTVTLTATVEDDGVVASVSANLENLGGDVVMLQVNDDGSWSATASVTPPTKGPMSIRFAAVDDGGLTANLDDTINVAASDDPTAHPIPPILANVSVEGELTQGLEAEVTVSCTATDSDGTVKSVIANLSAIGGSKTQALSASGDTWSWTGIVSPAVTGVRTVSLKATDDEGNIATGSSTIKVATNPGNQGPQISNASAEGDLQQGVAGEVTVSCTATDSDGTVESVVADLSSIGGNKKQALAPDGDVWSWTGAVTPPAKGTKTLTFTATDDKGATDEATADIDVIAGMSLAGAWKSQNTLADGTIVTLLIAEDGSAIAQIWSMEVQGMEIAAQFICDGEEHLITIYLGDTPLTVAPLLGTPYSYHVDAAGHITFNPYTLSIVGQGEWPFTGDGQVIDGSTIELNLSNDAYGDVTLQFAKLDAMPNLYPFIDDASVSGTLKVGESGTVDLVCQPQDVLGTVETVEADLSMIGGDVVTLTKQADGSYKATGVPVNPTTGGTCGVAFLGIDNEGALGLGLAEIFVEGSGSGSLEGAWSDGYETITIDAAGNAVSYTIETGAAPAVIPCDGVYHDTPMGPIMLEPHQFTLNADDTISVTPFGVGVGGDTGTWYVDGELLGPASMYLHFLQQWDSGGTSDFEAVFYQGGPQITDLQMTGTLCAGTTTTVTFTCSVTAGDAPVAGVQLDLWELGHDAGLEPMTQQPGGTWTWTGDVVPQYDDYVYVGVLAIDENGVPDLYTTTFNVEGGSSVDSLEGTWSDGWEIITIDAAGNAVSYSYDDDAGFFVIPCDGQYHSTPYGQWMLAPHTYTLNGDNTVTISPYRFDAYGMGAGTAYMWGTLAGSVMSLDFEYDMDDGNIYQYASDYTLQP